LGAYRKKVLSRRTGFPVDRFSVVNRAWAGGAVVVIGGGPSLTAAQVEIVRDAWCAEKVHVIAVNDAYLLAPWADVNYFADSEWWGWHTAGVARPKIGLTAKQVRERFAAFAGQKCSISESGGNITDPAVHMIRNGGTSGLSLDPEKICTGSNSGFQALNLAILAGAKTIILIGFDAKEPPAGEPTHWFGDHPRRETNAVFPVFRDAFKAAAGAIREAGVIVLNCSPGSAIDAFEKANLPGVLQNITGKPPLLLHGMQGMGDCLHARSIVRELMRENEIWLRTPWPQIYHDLPRLHLLPMNPTLRTQAKNEARSTYLSHVVPPVARMLRPSYQPAQVKASGSVLGAISGVCGVPVGDFRMPVPAAWRDKASDLFPVTVRPVLVYRPLVARTEWGGASTRNPDPDAYVSLFRAIRERFFVVSVADLVPGVEWTVGPQIQADVEYHAGELDFETLAGLFARAALVFSAPGFAVVLAQAIGTPAVTVFGGYEDARSFSAGARFSLWLAIEPRQPCACWSHTHQCDKTIDLPRAITLIEDFANAACPADHEPADSQDGRVAMRLAVVTA
jgi:ADP-heptose:LPS heptosyltransferase